jgi:hypothetical protein
MEATLFLGASSPRQARQAFCQDLPWGPHKRISDLRGHSQASLAPKWLCSASIGTLGFKMEDTPKGLFGLVAIFLLITYKYKKDKPALSD